jgi:predicted AAA+ superfamily ATPase
VDSPSGLSDLTEGAWLEQLVLDDLLAWRDLEIRKPDLYFYRSAAGTEIDFVLESGRRLLPIEVKSSRSARTDDARALDAFCREFGSRAPFGILLYDGVDAFRLSEKVIAAPLSAVL